MIFLLNSTLLSVLRHVHTLKCQPRGRRPYDVESLWTSPLSPIYLWLGAMSTRSVRYGALELPGMDVVLGMPFLRTSGNDKTISCESEQ